MNIKYRVKDSNDIIIGYEEYHISTGWQNWIIAEEEVRGDLSSCPLHYGVIDDFKFSIDFLKREAFTGIYDKNKNEIYENDKVLYNGTLYRIDWNKNQCGWYLVYKGEINENDILSNFNEKLGNGFINRIDLTLKSINKYDEKFS